MTLTPEAIDIFLKGLGFFHPEDASLIAFLREHEDTLAKIAAIADAAIEEGPTAWRAVQKAAPKLADAVLALLGTFPLQGLPAHPAPAVAKPDIVPDKSVG